MVPPVLEVMAAAEKRLLVVDDDEDFAESMKEIFVDLGYQVQTASSHVAALEAVRLFKPDVALIDVKLAHTSGVDLIKPLRAAYPFLQCVMMTAFAGMDTVIEALRLEALDYLQKPADLIVVRATVERCVSLGRLKRERAEAVEALHQSERKYRRLVESLNDEYFFYTLDASRRLTWTSPSIHHVLGRNAPQFDGTWKPWLASPENSSALQHHEDVLAGLPRAPWELTLDHAAGLRRLRVMESAVLDEAGKVIGLDGMAHDITEQAESQERFRQLANATQEAVVIHDGARIIEANEVFFDLFGYQPADLTALEVPALWCPPSRAEFERLGLPEAIGSAELVAQKRGGETFAAAVRVRPIPQHGRTVRVTAMRDLTAQRLAEQRHRQAEAQFRQAQKMEAIGQLTGGFAHDFSNILHGILGHAELASARLGLARYDAVGECVEQISMAGSRASELIKQMMLYSRGGAVKSVPMQVKPGVIEVLKILRATLPGSVELATHFEEAPDIRMDPTQLQQVLLNLCLNARDALGDKGRIEIQVRRAAVAAVCTSCGQPFSGSLVELAVHDNGAGMSAQLIGKIFDPFFTTKEPGKGTGMGLAVAHGLVHEHGGHIVVTSHEGTGTAFSLCFPAVEAVPATPSAGKAEPAPRGQGRILVVDDEVMVTNYLSELLVDAGYLVTALNDPTEALARFTATPRAWDMVLTDQVMPGMTGDKLAPALHAIRPDLPIILCTGFADGLDATLVTALGVGALLRKPCDAASTLTLVRDRLGPARDAPGEP